MEFHSYSSSSPSRKKKTTCKSNVQCSVYGCHNRSEAGLYFLPKESNADLRKKWIHVLRMEKVAKNARVCGKHFKDEDFMTPTRFSKGKIRRLRKGVIPSQFLPKSSIHKSPDSGRKRTIKNREERNVRRQLLMDEQSRIVLEPEMELVPCDAVENDSNQNRIMKDASTETECKLWQDAEVQCNTLMDGFDFGIRLIDFISTDGRMSTFTGINSMRKFNKICEAIEYLLSTVSDENLWSRSTMCTRQRILLTFVKLKMNIPFSGLAAFFDISEKLAADIFFSTIDILYIVLKEYIYWPSRDTIRDNLPNVFKKRFPNTRVILDCTEVSVQQFSCLICKTRTYSQYKCTHTIKILVGIAPCGLITFVSKAFGGRTSDKFIFLYSKILEKCEPGDAIMVDKGFLVQNECTLAGIQLIQPPFLGKKKHLTPKECEDNNDIARARVHVERIMQRIKVFQILNQKISLTYLESLDKIITIVCALVNLSEPILSDEHFKSETSPDNCDVSDVSEEL